MHRSVIRLAAAGISFLGIYALTLRPAVAQNYAALPLATNATDPDLINAWGISSSGGSPFWISDNGTGLATLYNVNPASNVATKLGLKVTIPGDGTPTGQAFNSVGGFNSDPFLFVSEDGTISGWRGALGTTAETLQIGATANVYKGVALANVGGNGYLYAANFRNNSIDVLKGNGAAPNLTGTFTDPTIPTGFAPFNIENLGGTLYVTYAKQDAAKHDDVAGLGNGYVDAYDTSGNFLGRVGSTGLLDSPWGLAIAPSSYGAFAGDLLVGNFGDGHINAFNTSTDHFDGQLTGIDGNPLSIDGLWALSPGNNGGAGSKSNIYFTAGPNGESGGEFGLLSAATPEPGSIGLLGGLLASGSYLALRRRRR